MLTCFAGSNIRLCEIFDGVCFPMFTTGRASTMTENGHKILPPGIKYVEQSPELKAL